MSKFKKGDQVEVIEVHRKFDKGDVLEVIDVDEQDTNLTYLLENVSKTDWARGECLKLVEPKRTKNQRITALEETVAKQGEEIAELKLIVGQIRQPSTEVQEALDTAQWERGEVEGVIEFEGAKYRKVDREARAGDVVIFRVNETDEFHSVVNKPYLVVSDDDVPRFTGESGTNYRVYADDHNRTPETVDVYELIVEDKPQTEGERLIKQCEQHFSPIEKSPNEKRAEMIEKAKGFIVKNKFANKFYKVPDGPFGYFHCDVEFIVNEQKRTVVALMHSTNNKSIKAKGIAKCMPDDVYNEHIGKAIALGRALGLDVSEFEQAVQPTEFAKGQIIRTAHMALDDHEIIRIKGNYAYFMDGSREEFHYLHRAQEDRFEIINDTNAIYSEVSE